MNKPQTIQPAEATRPALDLVAALAHLLCAAKDGFGSLH